MPSFTLSQTLNQSRLRLTPLYESARLDSDVLVAHALNCSRTQLYTWSDKILTEKECAVIDRFINRRYEGEPVAYITGYKEFWSLNFNVTKDTLIPRPETELLVELALAHIPPGGAWNIMDLGTGTGVIAIAIAKERPACQLLAVDQSVLALKVAAENAKKLGVKNISFQQSDWFAVLKNETFDLIISNPPYIATQDKHLFEGDLVFEPQAALVAGNDGLDDLRQIIKQAKDYLKPDATLLLEHGWDQSAKVSGLFEDASYQNVFSNKDLSGIERVTSGKQK